MIPNDALFIYDGGFILRKDLQMFYECKKMESLAKIRVINRHNWDDQKVWNISDLILMYGTRYPFGTHPETYMDPGPSTVSRQEAPPPRKAFGVQNQNAVIQDPNFSTTVSPAQGLQNEDDGIFTFVKKPRKVQTPILAPPPGHLTPPPGLEAPPSEPQTPPTFSSNLAPIFLPNSIISEIQNWPLLHGDYDEKEEEIFKTDEVEKEMETLRAFYPMKLWKIDDIHYFSFLEEGFPSYCHFCKYSPRCAREIIDHMLSQPHLELLKESKISKKSFEFWMNHFEIVNKKKGKKPQPFLVFPLLNNKKINNSNPKNEKIVEKMSNPDMAAISMDCSTLRNSIGEMPFKDEQHYLGQFFSSIYVPNICKVCNFDSKGKVYDMIGHVARIDHLCKLTSIPMREINFWKNILKLELECLKPDKSHYVEKSRKLAKILLGKNSTPIPLIDLQLDQDLKTGDPNILRMALNPLIAAFKSIRQEFWAEPPGLEHNLNVQCIGCSTDTEKVTLKSPASVLKHLVTNAHLEYLSTYGYNPADLLLVQSAFEEIAKGEFEIYQSLRSQISGNV